MKTYVIESLSHQTYVRRSLLFIWFVPSLAQKLTEKIESIITGIAAAAENEESDTY